MMKGARLTRRTVAWTTAAVVAAIVVVSGMIAAAPASTAGATAAEPSQPASITEPPSPAVPSPSASADRAPSPPAVAVATRSARLEDVVDARQPAPVRLDVGAIGIGGAPIDPVAVEADGSMEIPTDISRIGWYEYGPAPGEDEGTAVLTAHVDSRTQGEGVFYDLDALEPGDAVNVRMDDGTTRSFVVDTVRQVRKVELPTGALFRRDGRPRLALITCGGEFDASSRHYRDNLVVLATPAG